MMMMRMMTSVPTPMYIGPPFQAREIPGVAEGETSAFPAQPTLTVTRCTLLLP